MYYVRWCVTIHFIACLFLYLGLRAVHMAHVYDFYKPNLSSEYPVVDGKLSINCYLNALDVCYERYGDKVVQRSTSSVFSVDDCDYFCFHSPFVKLVQKSFSRLILQDYLKNPDLKQRYPVLEQLQ